MDRLTINRRAKGSGQSKCLPDGEGLPIWSKMPLDAKLPMMQIPKGAIVLCTTKLGEPKHRVKQEIDFDLRDPCGKYIPNEYDPLHDPHLKAHFSTDVMMKHLINRGFISDDKKIMCSLKEFNRYRRFLRFICLLDIARERKQELEEFNRNRRHSPTALDMKASKGSVVRDRLQQMRECRLNKLNDYLSTKDEKLQKRLNELRHQMERKMSKKRAEESKKQIIIIKNKEETERQTLRLLKKLRERDKARDRLTEQRNRARLTKMELKCLEKWDSRKQSQKQQLDRDEELMRRDGEERLRSVAKRQEIISKQRGKFDEKLNQLKQETRLNHQKREERYARSLAKRLSADDSRIGIKKKDRRKPESTLFRSAWNLEETLNKISFKDTQIKQRKEPTEFMMALNDAVAVDTVTKMDETTEIELRKRAREITEDAINRAISKFTSATNTSTLIGMFDEIEPEESATLSQSVRFTKGVEEIPKTPSITVTPQTEGSEDGDSRADIKFRPVQEHVLTPVASQSEIEIQRMEAEALLGSPAVSGKITSTSFVETLLLRLLDDLNGGRLSKDDIMKLASYSMEILRSTETEKPTGTIIEQPDREVEEDTQTPASSSSIIANRMVDFTLSRILRDIESGKIDKEDMAALSVMYLESDSDSEDAEAIYSTLSESEIDELVDDTLRNITSTLLEEENPTSPVSVCDAMLDEFMVGMLQNLTRDLEEETLSKEQIQSLAFSVKEEVAKGILDVADTEDTDTAGIQRVMVDLLSKMKSGDIELNKLHQIVFAIVHPYSMLKYPDGPNFETKVTDLLKSVLMNIGQLSCSDGGDIDLATINAANDILARNELSPNQIKALSPTIVDSMQKVAVAAPSPLTEADESAVESALSTLAQQLRENQLDAAVIKSVERIASAVVSVRHENAKTPTTQICNSLLDILRLLQKEMEANEDMDPADVEKIAVIIREISENKISCDNLLQVANSVAQTVLAPKGSEDSLTDSTVADLAVSSALRKVFEDIKNSKNENIIVDDVLESLDSTYRSFTGFSEDTVSTVSALASLLRYVFQQVAYKIQCGEYTEKEIHDLSNVFKDKMKCLEGEKKSEITAHLLKLVNELDSCEMDAKSAENIGHRLVICGKKLVKSFAGKETSQIKNEAVAEVIRSIKMDIDSGKITPASLNEITRSYIDSTGTETTTTYLTTTETTTATSTTPTITVEEDSSDSHIADDIIQDTISGIYLDIGKGKHVQSLSSVASSRTSSAASIIAGKLVMDTLDFISTDISRHGLNPQMIASVAASFASLATDEVQPEADKLRKTMAAVTECVKKGQLNEEEAKKMFCMILESYQKQAAGSDVDVKVPDQEDAILVRNLVQETLDHFKRGASMEEVSQKPGSDDTESFYHVDDLIGQTLAEIKYELEQKGKKDISDFILEIVQQLLAGLNDGSISNISMAQFYLTIEDGVQESPELEENAAENLSKVISDIQKNRMCSKYVSKIVDTYLTPEQETGGMFVSPVKAIEVILMNVSTEILTKFVRATIHNILSEMQDQKMMMLTKPPPTYVLRTASASLAEGVIREVIFRVNAAVLHSVTPHRESLTREDFDRMVSILARAPSGSAKAAQVQEQSISTGFEDIMLETLHNIVSNLRLEVSMSPGAVPETSENKSLTGVSKDIQEFVLQTLQNIVTDLQDERLLPDLETTGTSKPTAPSSTQTCDAGGKRETVVYINKVLLSVIQDLQEIKLSQKKSILSTAREQDLPSLCLEMMILDGLKNAVTDQTSSSFKILPPQQNEDVRRIVTESMRKTAENIRAGKFNREELITVAKALLKCAENYTDLQEKIPSFETELTNDVVARMAEDVLERIERSGLDEQSIQRVSMQLATLGLDELQIWTSKTPEVVSSNLSIDSAEINSMVQGVITHIAHQLGPPEEEIAGYLPSSPLPPSDPLDTNVNRKLSASSTDTQVTLKSDSDEALRRNSTVVDVRKAVKKYNENKAKPLPKAEGNKDTIARFSTCKPAKSDSKSRVSKSTKRDVYGQDQMNLTSTVNRNVNQTSKTFTGKKDSGKDKETRTKSETKRETQNTATPGVKVTTSLRPNKVQPQSPHRPRSTQKKGAAARSQTVGECPENKGKVKTQNKKTSFDTKQINKRRQKSSSPVPNLNSCPLVDDTRKTSPQQDLTPQQPSMAPQRQNMKQTQSDTTPQKMELKSLCGIHKTTVERRESTSTVSSSEGDRSFTSDVF